MLSLEAFNKRLEREFGGRLRARYSPSRDEYHIEQRVGSQVSPPFRINSWDDDAIRARDGYGFVMAIRKGDRMPCPECHLTLKVPHMKVGEITCEYCKFKGRGGKYYAGFYPLGEALIQHLRSIDPQLSWRDDIRITQDAFNKRLQDAKDRDLFNHIESGTKEHYNKIVGIPTFHYARGR